MKVLQKNGEMAEMSFEEQEGRKAFWHTSAHVLAHAVKHLYPDTKCAIGPAIENGFYYDFELIEGLIHRNEKSVTLHGPMRASLFYAGRCPYFYAGRTGDGGNPGRYEAD